MTYAVPSRREKPECPYAADRIAPRHQQLAFFRDVARYVLFIRATTVARYTKLVA